MTFSIAEAASADSVRGPASTRVGFPPGLLVAVGGVLTLALSWNNVADIWRTGTFFDTDDAMRMVQLRAWLDGQNWFDLTVHRLDPPQGVFMHWSHVIDLPLGCLVRFFELFTTQAYAELLTRLAFPIALQVGLIAAMIFAARVLVGPVGGLPAMLLGVTSCVQFGQFIAGRIDHHAPQITLLFAIVGLTSDAVLNRRRSSAALIALACVVSMAISLENLPFIAIVITALGLIWMVDDTRAPVLRSFGLALAGWVPALFILFIPPSRYGVVSSDAFSLPHLIGAVLGGLALAALTCWPFKNSVQRGVAAICAALAVGGVMLAACPGVLAGPYAALDPVVRSVWLVHVTEAMPLTTAVRLHPQAATLIVAPLLVGLAALACAAYRSCGARRAVYLMVAALVVTGLAGAMWEVRVIASVTPIALLGGVWAFAAVAKPDQSGETPLFRTLIGFFVLFPFAPLAWAAVPTPAESSGVTGPAQAAESCRQADHVTPLASLPAGLVFATIDSGSHLLVHTPHSVLGAPYHRNNHGNRVVIDGFSAEGADAERIVTSAGARYVALCPGQVQAEALTSRNPNGLAAQLLAGRVPEWLEKVDVPSTPYLIYAVKSLRPTLAPEQTTN